MKEFFKKPIVWIVVILVIIVGFWIWRKRKMAAAAGTSPSTVAAVPQGAVQAGTL